MSDGTEAPSVSFEEAKPAVNGGGASLLGHQRNMSLRRPSAPMAPAFMVSAPGKVIVFGEHSVVYGKVRNAHCCDTAVQWLTDLSRSLPCSGCHCCCHLPPIIPPCHNAVEIETHRLAPFPRHRPHTYLGH
jgi:hypothetical protein